EDLRSHPGTRLVQRARFDESMVAIAAAAGASVIQPGRARGPHRTSGGWIVPIETDAGRRCAKARILVDPAGRPGGFGRKRCHLAPATVALTARWTTAAVPAGEIWIEALPDGWCWGGAPGDGVLETATFVSMAECRGRGRKALGELHRALLRQSSR